MNRNIFAPTASLRRIDTVVAINKGGTGATNATDAVNNIGGLPLSLLGQPNGVAAAGSDGELTLDIFPNGGASGSVTMTGVLSLVVNQSTQYTITNYDSFKTYTLSAVSGSVSRSGDIITYTAGATAGAGGFIVNGKTVNVTITAITVNQASITSPTAGATGLSGSVAFTGGAFGVTGGSDTHQGSDWQIATDTGFTNIVASVTNDAVNKTTWTGSGLSVSTVYYSRVRYKGVTYGYGAWSSTVSFATKAVFVPQTEEAKLTASDKITGDNFGYSVSISSDGSRVVVGARNQDGGVTDAGAAYIFLRTGTSWAQEAKIVASDRAASDYFGWSVSISSDGSRVVVGAYAQDGGVTDAGAAYIFLRSGTSWTQEAKIVASDRAASDYFGMSVSISSDGSRVVVGAYLQDGGVTDAGAAYIYG